MMTEAAQSRRDCGDSAGAVKAYLRRADQGYWREEAYISLLNGGQLWRRWSVRPTPCWRRWRAPRRSARTAPTGHNPIAISSRLGAAA